MTFAHAIAASTAGTRRGPAACAFNRNNRNNASLPRAGD